MTKTTLATKRCRNRECNEIRPVSEFYREKRNKDGLKSYCKPCCRKLSREHPNKKARQAAYYAATRERWTAHRRQRYQDNKESESERTRKWRQQNPDRCKENAARYYQENKDRIDEKNRLWRENNHDAWNQLQRDWKHNNRDYGRVTDSRRRARKRAVTVIPFTRQQLSQRWAYYGNKCWICREPATQTDHVKPLAKGGAHMLCNLRPICTACNSRKRDTWPYPV